jgi:3-oxoacyl-[acyl-carrier protein] reductase
LILGGSSELARATIRELDRPGLTVLAQYRGSSAALDELSKSLAHAKLLAMHADLSTGDGIERFAVEVSEKLAEAGSDALEAMVLFASPAPVTERFHRKSWENFALHLDVQVRAPAALLARFLPDMAKRRRGRVVFVLSSYTLGHPPAGLSDYVTAKHAALGLMRALAAEYGSKNIRINAVSPGMVETEFLQEVPRVVVEMNADKHPLGRNAKPSDVVPAICFLLSDAVEYINGANLPITGGAAS